MTRSHHISPTIGIGSHEGNSDIKVILIFKDKYSVFRIYLDFQIIFFSRLQIIIRVCGNDCYPSINWISLVLLFSSILFLPSTFSMPYIILDSLRCLTQLPPTSLSHKECIWSIWSFWLTSAFFSTRFVKCNNQNCPVF